MFAKLKTKTSKIMAFVLAIAIVVGMVPVSLMTAFAETTNYLGYFTVSVKDTQGNPVEEANVAFGNGDLQWSIYLTAQTDANGIAAFDSNEIKAAFEAGVAAGTITSEFVAGNVTAIKSGYKLVSNKMVRIYADAGYTDHVELTMTPTITNVEIAGNNLAYNGTAQKLVSVTNAEGYTVEYYLNGATTPTTEEPTATNVGNYSVKVVVSRDGFLPLETTVSASITAIDIPDLDIEVVADLKYNEKNQELVTLKGSFKDDDIVTWTVNGTEESGRAVPARMAHGTYTVTLTVERGENYNKFSKTVTVDIALGEIDLGNLEITANNRTYNGTEEDLLVVTGEGDYSLLYSTDNKATWVENTIPKATNAGEYKVWVKAVKTEDYAEKQTEAFPMVVTIAKAEITGVTATGYSGIYDGQSHKAIEYTGALETDTVTYSMNADGSNDTATVPMVKDVPDSGKYYLVVYRSENYQTLIVEVEVSIGKKQQELSFSDVESNIFYNENNTFTHKAATNALDATGTITYEKAGGTADFTVASDGTVTYTTVGTIKVKATISACDNYSAASKEYTVTVSYITTPEWTITPANKTIDGCNWYSGNVVIAENEADETWSIIKGSNALGQNGWASEITESDEKEYSGYKVAFKDADGNITDLVSIDRFAIDTTAPTQKNGLRVDFKDKHTDTVSKVIHALSFGLFCNEELEVTVTCDDEAKTAGSPNSGIASIQLFKYDINGNSTEVALDDDKTNVFTLPIGFEGTVKVKVTDKVGNTVGEKLVNEDNSNMKEASGYIMIEKTAPVLSELKVVAPDGVHNEKGTHHYSGDVTVSFDAQDTGSGLYSVTVELNGEDYPVTPTTFATQDRDNHHYELSTEGKIPNENGEFIFVFTLVDNAGNVTTDTLTVEKDLTAPVISGFEFEAAGENVSIQDVISLEDYGYYFKEPVTVTVHAEDKKAEDANEYISGVDTITVVLVDKEDINNYKYYTVKNVNGENVVEEIDSVSKAEAITVINNAVSFTIKEDFKGQIYAFATDKVGNNHTNSTFNFNETDVVNDGDLKGYKYPNGSVYESPDKHENVSYDHITFDKIGTNLKTTDGKELYATDVDVKLTVTDIYSGIQSIEWSVVAPYDTANNQKGDVTFANGELAESDWTVLEKDNNLVTKAEKTITVSNNSNNIVVSVKLTDRAGNTSEESIEFCIDKTAPIITVEMNDDDDNDKAGFFKTDRNYKVSILERNFIKDVTFNVTVTDDNDKQSTVTVTPDFKVVKEADEPKVTVIDGIEFYTYEWESKFTADGDYTFSISATDLAENNTEDTAVSYVNEAGEDIKNIAKAFTIDQTQPTVSVSFDNNSAANLKYFAKARTATVVINEHNFDVNRVNITVTAKLKGEGFLPENLPAPAWVHEGNVHTATIAFTADGDYTFNVAMTDKAGNENATVNYGDSVAANDFVVDQSIDKPVISGISKGGAYAKEVAPSISFTDANYDSCEITLVRTRMGEKNVNVTSTFLKDVFDITDSIYTRSVKLETIKKVVENDGIYTLTVTVRDMAGNEENETYTFSVNQFGSVYEYDDTLVSLIKDGGQYVQSVRKDLVITEYSAVKLTENSLQLLITRDGEPIDAVYTCTPEVNNSAQIGESGWYQYVYTIKAANFEKDGVYKVSLSSKYATLDSAENNSTSVPENSTDKKGNEIVDTINFTVDSVAPEIRNIVNLDKAIANKDKIVDGKLNIKYTVVDVGGLKKIEVVVDGETVQSLTEEDIAENAYNFSGEFDLDERSKAYSVQIKVTDLAGNVTDTQSEDFANEHSKANEASTYLFFNEITVSRNFFVRWFANTALFWGSVAGVVVVAGGAWFLVASKKKKKEI